MQEIIDKAIERGYDIKNQFMAGDSVEIYLTGEKFKKDKYQIFSDQEFWKSLIQSEWSEKYDTPAWLEVGIKFHEINLTQGFEKAVEYLQDLIK